VVSDRDQRNLTALLGGFGAALLVGGLFATGVMILVPFQSGLAELWGEKALADPAFYIFAGFAILFLILAGVGACLCLRAYRLYRPKRLNGPE